MAVDRFPLASSVLDAMDANVAVLDATGHIVYVNAAWQRFGRLNGAPEVQWLGRSYLDECFRAAETDEEAGRVFSALRQLLDGNLTVRRFTYECSTETQKRIFSMHLSGFEHDGSLYAVVMHHNITIEHLADERRRVPA